MQPLSEVIKNTKATTDMISSFISYLLTLTPMELTTFYCEVCHERQGTHTINRPGNPFHEARGICTGCGHYEEVSNPAVNQFLNENELTLERDADFLSGFGDCSEQLNGILHNWLTPTDYGLATYPARIRNDPPAQAWVMYGRKKAKEVYKASSLGVVYKVMLLDFFPSCYSIERFNANPIGDKISQEVNNEEDPLSEPEALFTLPAVAELPALPELPAVAELPELSDLPAKPSPQKGWLSRIGAFFR